VHFNDLLDLVDHAFCDDEWTGMEIHIVDTNEPTDAARSGCSTERGGDFVLVGWCRG
jgi:hypothetical protein